MNRLAGAWLRHRIVVSRIAAGTVAALALLEIAARILPTQPLFPGDTLDLSWAWAINIATAGRLVFGRDVIFTYGPYAAVASGMYAPDLRMMIIGGSLLILAAVVSGLIALGRPAVLLCMVVALPFVQSNQAFEFILPIAAMLLASQTHRAPPSRGADAAIVLAMPALGLLPLVKLSFLPVTLIGLAGIVVMLCARKRIRFALCLPLVAGLSMALLWREAGQPLAALPGYFRSGAQIIAGYGPAMSLFGPPGPACRAAAEALAVMALMIAGMRRVAPIHRVVLASGVAAILFVAGKAGFVRQDPAHVGLTFATVGLTALILAAWLPGRAAYLALGLGVAILVGEGGAGSPAGDGMVVAAGFTRNLPGLWRALADAPGLARDFAQSAAAIRPLPWHPPGTADIYAYDQARLFASGLHWAPRPVLQSYSAYTPALARLDADHLLSPAAADNIFFRVEPIDNRLPAGEDGASWPALLSRYQPAGYDMPTDTLWLSRAAPGTPLAAPGAALMAGRRSLGEVVALPDAPALWATIDERPSGLGTLAGVVAKSPHLHIRLHLSDGTARDYGLVPGVAKAGFLLSPLIATAEDFLDLRQAATDRALDPPRVVAFSLDAGPGTRMFWRRRYSLTVNAFAPPAAPPMQDPPGAVPAATGLPPPSPGFNCYIYAVNGAPIPKRPIQAGALVRLRGWGAFNAAAGIAADGAEIAFQGASGNAWAVQAAPLATLDGIGAFFHQPSLRAIGVTAQADLGALPPGPYAVQMVLHHGSQSMTCQTQVSLLVPPTAKPPPGR